MSSQFLEKTHTVTRRAERSCCGDQRDVLPASDQLSREVYGFLGMPLDALDRNEVVNAIGSARSSVRSLLLSTPNVNFLVMAQCDSEFRETLLQSDLCPADGMPIVWLARMMGIPIRQRVSGSDIFDVLRTSSSSSPSPIKVFLFGGGDGAAQTVCRILNAEPTGMQCVGWMNPGYGTVEEMSSQTIIDTINDSRAELLAVFLSAKKAQSWLLRNHGRLTSPICGQFGATISYQAGTVRRAPILFQRLGFEWLWRIKEEPYLWRRYLRDGLSLARIIVTQVLPIKLMGSWQRFMTRDSKKQLLIEQEHRGPIVIRLIGYATKTNILQATAIFRSALAENRDIVIDLSKTALIDPRFYGLLLMLKKQVESGGATLNFAGASKWIDLSFRLNGFEFLLGDRCK